MASQKLKLGKLSILALVGGFLLFSWLVFKIAPPALAANSCNFTKSGDFTLGSGTLTANNCSITTSTIDGIDAGNLTIGPGKTITIDSNAQLVINPGKEIHIDPSAQLIIAKPSNPQGALIKGSLCVKDADQDGYVDVSATTNNQANIIFTNSPSCSYPPYVSKASVASTTFAATPVFDDFDTDAAKQKQDCVPSWANSGWINVGTCGQYTVGEQKQIKSWTFSVATPASTSGATCAATSYDEYQSISCCTTGYKDFDKDGYGTGAQGCYVPSASYNVVANANDCDDGNAAIIQGSTRATHCGDATCSDTGAGGSAGTETCTGGSWTTTASCVVSTAACCSAGNYRASNYVCSTGSYNNPADGSCSRLRVKQYCTGSAATCSGSTQNDYDYGSPGQVWWSGTWQTVTATIRAGVNATNSCSGQQPQGNALACNGAGSPTYPTSYKVSVGLACSGAENDFCSGGTCSNLCSDNVDNDGNGYKDLLDLACGAQCTSGACCDTSTNQYRPSSYTCRASAGLCDLPTSDNCTGASDLCPTEAYKTNGTVCRAAAGVCDAAETCNGTSPYCSGLSNQPDYKVAAGTVCRSAGANATCNPAETCNGSGNNCPGDTNTDGVLCASASGSCDNSGYCSGGTCPGISYKSSGTVCAYGSFDNPANGSCIRTTVDVYCGGSSSLCNGSTGYRYDYGSSGQVWWSGTWQTVTATIRAGVSATNSCSGQQPQANALACNGAGATYSSSYKVNVGSSCAGNESDWCASGSGTCTNYCSPNGSSQTGSPFTDNQNSVCYGYGQCTSGACCNTANGSYTSNGTPCDWGIWALWAGSNGACTITHSRNVYKCTGSSSSCPGTSSGTDYESFNLSNTYVWWNGASVFAGVPPTYPYCGLTGLGCSVQQPYGIALGCNGSGSCSYYTGSYVNNGSACNGTTNTCVNGACLACTSGYKDYDRDGYGTIGYGCYYMYDFYNVVSNNTDCNDGNAGIYNTYNLLRDADGDGYGAGTPTATCMGSTPPSGWVWPTGNDDCNDSNASLTVLRTLWTDTDGDGYYGTVTGSACVTAAQSAASITARNNYPDCADNNPAVTIWRSGYYDKDGDGYFGTYSPTICMAASQVSASSNDCNDSNTSVHQNLTYYEDFDGDGYGTVYNMASVCSGAPTGFVSNNTDCYDQNANAHPGQTAYFTTNRGDGSFDYDCSGAATTAGAWDRYVTGDLGYVQSMKDNVNVCGASNGGSTCLNLATGAGGCGKANYGTWGALHYYALAGCAGSAYAQDNYHCGYPLGTTISCH